MAEVTTKSRVSHDGVMLRGFTLSVPVGVPSLVSIFNSSLGAFRVSSDVVQLSSLATDGGLREFALERVLELMVAG